ncbi:prefoldin subunit alpha [Candidatus Pacearchaeota archaeon ex4484_71]|nr:MAG: prefoldin subunit alpha [Candidatus Pacearchaeota archaeon ex4484_71]
MDDQELQRKFQVFESQIMGLQQQLQAVDQAMVELKQLHLSLDDLKGNEGKEVLAPIGRGVYAKTKLSSEDLVIDIGNKTYVDKSIPGTKEIISEQIKKLENSKVDLNRELENLNQEITRTFLEHQKLHQGHEGHEHHHH